MKKIKTLILLVSLTFISGFVNAQTKVAQINSNELIAIMPEMELAKAEFEKLKKTYEEGIEKLISDYQNKLKIYKDKYQGKSSIEANSIRDELLDLDKQITLAKGDAQQIIDQKYMELLKPILERASSVVQKVGREQGFSIVIDSSMDSAYLLKDGDLPNLMEAVKKELNIRD